MEIKGTFNILPSIPRGYFSDDVELTQENIDEEWEKSFKLVNQTVLDLVEN